MKYIRLLATQLCLVFFTIVTQETLFVIDQKLIPIGKDTACPLITWAHNREINAAICFLVKKVDELNSGKSAYTIIQDYIKDNQTNSNAILQIAKNLGFDITTITADKEAILKQMILKLFDQTILIKHESIKGITVDKKGYLNEQSAKNLLMKLHNKLPEPGFQDISCLESKDLIENKGFYTSQLFSIRSCNGKDYILKEMSLGTKEAKALTKGNLAPQLQPIIAPNSQPDLPQLFFPIFYLSYTFENKLHILSLMYKANGRSLGSYFIDYGKALRSNDQELIEKTKNNLRVACTSFGLRLGRFHKHFAQKNTNAVLPLTITHGDLHYFNVFVAPEENTSIALIDNEKIINSIIQPADPLNDVGYFFDIMFLTMFKEHYTNMVKIFGPLSRDLKNSLIVDAYKNILSGYILGQEPDNTENQKKIIDILQTRLSKPGEYAAAIDLALLIIRSQIDLKALVLDRISQFNYKEYETLPLAFELRNKTKSPLVIDVINGKYTHHEYLPTAKSSEESDIPALQLKIDKNQKTEIEISYKDTDNKVVTFKKLIPAQKTMFLTFENGKLRPQKGHLGKASSGIEIPIDNVTQEIIDQKN